MNKILIVGLALLVVSCTVSFAQTADSLAYTQVSPGHGLLERLSGQWNTLVRLWPSAADTQAMESIGKSWTSMTLEGRVLTQRDSAHLEGKRYGTLAMLGFDNLKHKYVVTWTDTRTTQLLNLSGTVNDSGNVVTLEGEREQPKGGKSKVKFIYRSVNGNYRMLEIWEARAEGKGKAGKERKVMEIVYTRGK